MLKFLRPTLDRLMAPVGRGLHRLGISPNVITLIGTAGVVAGALFFYPRGELYIGTVFVTVFVLFDMLDGAVARAAGSDSAWGAFLDSTLDRLSDAAILCGLLLWFMGGGDDWPLAMVALFCLVSGFAVSYIKARAEGLGANCDVGFAERTERLVLLLVVTALHGLGFAYVLAGGLWLLAVISAVTVVQRLIETHNRLTTPRRHAGDSGTSQS